MKMTNTLETKVDRRTRRSEKSDTPRLTSVSLQARFKGSRHDIWTSYRLPVVVAEERVARLPQSARARRGVVRPWDGRGVGRGRGIPHRVAGRRDDRVRALFRCRQAARRSARTAAARAPRHAVRDPEPDCACLGVLPAEGRQRVTEPSYGFVDESFGPARALRAVGTVRGQRYRVAHRLPPLACLSPTKSTGPTTI